MKRKKEPPILYFLISRKSRSSAFVHLLSTRKLTASIRNLSSLNRFVLKVAYAIRTAIAKPTTADQEYEEIGV